MASSKSSNQGDFVNYMVKQKNVFTKMKTEEGRILSLTDLPGYPIRDKLVFENVVLTCLGHKDAEPGTYLSEKLTDDNWYFADLPPGMSTKTYFSKTGKELFLSRGMGLVKGDAPLGARLDYYESTTLLNHLHNVWRENMTNLRRFAFFRDKYRALMMSLWNHPDIRFVIKEPKIVQGLNRLGYYEYDDHVIALKD